MIKQILSYKLYFPILIGVLLYANVVTLNYNLDDELVTRNHRLTSQGISAFGEILNSPYYQDAMGYEYGYRPIVHLSFALEHELFGESAKVSHFINLLIYLITVLILIKLIQSIFSEIKPEILIAVGLLFMFLPIHIETVVSIKNRDELLSLMFGLLSFKFLLTQKFSYTNFFFSILFVILSLYSKKSSYPLFQIVPIFILIAVVETQTAKWYAACAITIISTFITFDQDLYISLIALIFTTQIYYFAHKQISDHKYLLRLLSKFYELSSNFIFSTVILIVLFSLSYVTNNILLEILFYLASGWFIYHKPDNFIIPIALLVLSFFKGGDNYKNIAIILLFYCFSNKSKFWIYALITVVLILGLELIWKNIFTNWGFLTLLFSTLFAAKVYRFKYFKIGVLLFNFLFILFFDWEVLVYLSGPFFLLFFKNKKINSKYPLLYGLIMAFITISSFFEASFKKVVSDYDLNYEKKIVTDSNIGNRKILSEARILEYSENSLVSVSGTINRIPTGLYVMLRYLKLHLIPQPLSFYYGYAELENKNWTDWTVIVSFIIHSGLLFLAFGVFHTHRILSFGIFWYLGSIFIFSNIPVLVAGMMGERLAYTASVGYSIAIGYSFWLGKEWLRKKLNIPEKVHQIKGSVKKVTENVKVPIANLTLYNTYSVVLPFLVLGYYAYIIQTRIPQWDNHLTLMRHDIQHLQKSAGANNLLAVNLVKYSFEAKTVEEMESMRREAVSYFKRALEIYPQFFNAAYDLGRTYVLLNELQKAKDAFVMAYKIDNQNLLVLEELTKTCFDLNMIAETEYYGNLYIALDPYNEHIHDLVAYIVLKNGQKIKAQYYAERGLQYFPNGQNLRMIYFDSLK